MEAFVHTIGSHSNPDVVIALYGPNRPENLRKLAVRYGAKQNRVCLVKAASTATDPGYQEIVDAKFGRPESEEFDVYADGVVLTKPRDAAIIQPADCSVLTLYEPTLRRAVAAHAGRAALTPTLRSGGAIDNIVTRAYQSIDGDLPIPPFCQAHISATICGRCFPHDQPDALRLIEPFDSFGPEVFHDRATGSIDLTAVLQHQLETLGVYPITQDGLCTYESDWLASYRRDRSPARNAVVVVLR